MQQQISLLEQIQRIDLEIQEIETEINNGPLEVESIKEKIEKERDDIRHTEELLDESAKSGRLLEGELELCRVKIKNWEAQLGKATNEKEYRALLKEIDKASNENKEREEKILEIMDNIENGRNDIVEKKEELDKSMVMFESAIEDIGEKKDKLDKKLEEKGKIRLELSKEIQPNILKRYESVKGTKKVAIVPARNSTCLGCYMSIPPQTFIQVQRRGMVVNCPHCHRILFWEGN